jgi:hypothetical protein
MDKEAMLRGELQLFLPPPFLVRRCQLLELGLALGLELAQGLGLELELELA